MYELQWLYRPITNEKVAALILGRVSNGSEFHLRQACVLYGSRVETAGLREFGKAAKIIDQLSVRARELGGQKWTVLDRLAERFKEKWRWFGQPEHLEHLEQLESEIRKVDHITTTSKEDRHWVWEYLEDSIPWAVDLDRSLTSQEGVIGEAQRDCFELGRLLDEGIRPRLALPSSGRFEFEEDRDVPKYRKSILRGRFGTIACQPGEAEPKQTWAHDLAKLLRCIGAESLVGTLNDPLPDSAYQRVQLVEDLCFDVQRILEAGSKPFVREETHIDSSQMVNGTPEGGSKILVKSSEARAHAPKGDESSYFAATFLANKFSFEKYPHFKRFLDDHPEVRTKSPRVNRLLVHLGDFAKACAKRDKEREREKIQEEKDIDIRTQKVRDKKKA